jgi:hypothetical protein
VRQGFGVEQRQDHQHADGDHLRKERDERGPTASLSLLRGGLQQGLQKHGMSCSPHRAPAAEGDDASACCNWHRYEVSGFHAIPA